MKKKALLVFFIGAALMAHADENRIVKIVLNLSPIYGGGTLEIFNDSYRRVASMIEDLSKARRIGILFLAKEALSEGEYNIDIYENDILIQQYIVFNSRNVYDRNNNRYLQSNVLADIYEIFVYFLLREREVR